MRNPVTGRLVPSASLVDFETLPEYPLATIPQKKRELAARGVDVIDLGAGDADLAPPPKAVEALDEARRTRRR